MKLTRRSLFKLAGAVKLAGAATVATTAAATGVGGCGTGVDEYDPGPDQEYDGDMGELEMPVPDPDPDPDGTGDAGVGSDASVEPGTDASVEPGTDASVGDDASIEADANVEPETDASIEPGPDASVEMDSGVVVEPPRDASTGVDAVVVPPRDAAVMLPANATFAGIDERSGMFPLGVMAGDARGTSAMFWTKYTGSGNLFLRVLETRGTETVAVRFNQRVEVGDSGFVRVIVNNLRPGRFHKYAFLVGGANSPTGRSKIGKVRTAIADDALEPIKFAGSCCTHIANAPLDAMRNAGMRTDLDFFIHAGDHLYADMGGTGPARTLAEYREKYSNYWNISGLNTLHRAMGMYNTWDDHEVDNNWDPETIAGSRIGAARRTFFEHNPIRRNTNDPSRLWRSFRWGRTAEIFVLDSRGERKPSTRSADPSRNSVYISRAQMDWLKQGLRSSPCVFKFIVNSVPIYNRPGGNGDESDNWTSYASQRREILTHIDNSNIKGVLWLSGDVHYGGVTRVERSGPLSNIWEVIMGPGGAESRNPPNLDPQNWPARAVQVHNYTVISADPNTRKLTVEYFNKNGQRINGGFWQHTV